MADRSHGPRPRRHPREASEAARTTPGSGRPRESAPDPDRGRQPAGGRDQPGSVTVEWFQCVQTVSGEARGTHVFNLAAPRAAATLRRRVRTSVIRHRIFRLNLRLRETELRLERLAPTESAFAHGHLGPKGNLDKDERWRPQPVTAGPASAVRRAGAVPPADRRARHVGRSCSWHVPRFWFRGATARRAGPPLVGELMLHVACPQQAPFDAHVHRHHG
jgi:hypothetical protein